MQSSLTQTKLTKIHTYADDLKTVRQTKVVNTSSPIATANQTPAQPVLTKSPVTKEKSTSATSNAMIIPKKPALPAIRTMVVDSKNISRQTAKLENNKTVTTTGKTAKKSIPTDYQPATAIKNTSLPTKTSKPNPEMTRPQTPTVTPPIKIKNTSKYTADRTYSATVITDAKHKRFSLWHELTKKLKSFITLKNSRPRRQYTTNTSLIRKGIIQTATTNTARKTVADYSSFKQQLKTKVETEPNYGMATKRTAEANLNSQTFHPSWGEQTNGKRKLSELATIEKTRSELLTSIEEAVSNPDKVLPEYLTSIPTGESVSTSISKPEQPAITDQSNSISDLPEAKWKHYLPETPNEEIVATDQLPKDLPSTIFNQTKILNSNSVQSPSEIKTTLITPIIPIIPLPISNIASEANQTNNFDPDLDQVPETEFTDYPQVIDEVPVAESVFTNDQVIDNQTYPSLETTQDTTSEFVPVEENLTENNFDPTLQTGSYFTQPKILPTIPNLSNQPTTIDQTAFLPPEDLSVMTPTINPLTNVTPEKNNLPTDWEYTSTKKNTKYSPSQTTKKPNQQITRITNFLTNYTHSFILGGLIIASITVLSIIGVGGLFDQFKSNQPTTPYHNYFNSSNLHIAIINPVSKLTITEEIAKYNNAISVSELIIQNQNSTSVSAMMLSQILELPLDPAFNASLAEIRFGWYRNEPFIVINYLGDSIARGALLKWETTIYTDLLPVFKLTPLPNNKLTNFRDTITSDWDTRTLYTITGDETLIYGVVKPGHILITTNELSFINLANNFNSK